MKLVFIGEDNPTQLESVCQSLIEGTHFTFGKEYAVNDYYYKLHDEWKTNPQIQIQDDMGNWFWVESKCFLTLNQWREKQINETFKTI